MSIRQQLIDILPANLRTVYDTVVKLDQATVKDVIDATALKQPLVHTKLLNLLKIGLVGRVSNTKKGEAKTGHHLYFALSNETSTRMSLGLERTRLSNELQISISRIQELDDMLFEEPVNDYFL